MKRWFQPTLSFDAFAFVVALLIGAIAYGKLTSTVDRHEKDIGDLKSITARHDTAITEIETREKLLLKPPVTP